MEKHTYRFTGTDAEPRRDSVYETMIKDRQFKNIQKDQAFEDGGTTFLLNYEYNDPLEHITELLKEVTIFDHEAFPVPHELLPTDKIVGDMPPWLCRLYALSRFYAREAARLSVEQQFEKHDTKICTQTQEYTARFQLLDQILWYELRHYFDLFHSQQIGVRENWKCVESEPKPRSFDVRHLFGGFPQE